jgi:hypothetical protein
MADSPTDEPQSVFVCACEEWMRSACYGEASYQINELVGRSRKVQGKQYCVLHLPSKEKSADFDKALKRKLENKDFNFCGTWFPDDLSLQGLTFDKSVDFRTAVFNGIADFRRVAFMAASKFDDASFKARAQFDQVTFGGSASFQSTKFLSYVGFGRAKFVDQVSLLAAEFPEGVNFLHTVFNADVDFHGSKFGGIAFFRATQFSSNVDFEYATFHEANFSDTTFGGTSDFSESLFEAEANYFLTSFLGLANFYSVNFKGTSNFRQTRFSALASFDRSTFNEAAYFSYATFDAETCFTEASFNSSASFSRTNFGNGADFSYARFNDMCGFVGDDKAQVFGIDSTLNLQHCRIQKPGHLSFHTLGLRPYWFVNIDARELEFTNVDWHWRNIKEEVESLKTNRISSGYRLFAIACRQLSVNAEENHRYEEASKFRYMAMDARRREQWHGIAFWRLSWWYWLASGYGERVFQAFLVLLGIWLIAGFAYTRVGFAPRESKLASERDLASSKREEVDAPQKFSRALTYSAGVMTLQKPEPRPATTAAQTVVLLETILGPVQAALLALAIRRKFMR